MLSCIKKFSSFIIAPALFMAIKLEAGTGVGPVTVIDNPIKSNTVAELLNSILEIVVEIGIVVVTMGIIYAGFLYVTARGDRSKVTNAHQAFYYTIIGAAVVLGAFAILKVISDTAEQVLSTT